MKPEKMVRRVERIHIGEGRYIGPRAVRMVWYGAARDEDDEDEMETLALMRFSVNAEEYAALAKQGLVDSISDDDEEEGRPAKIAFRTDRDLLDEAEDTIAEEWEQSQDDDTCPLTVWTDLDLWEVHEID